jgi:hypothetical protein
MPWNIRPNPVRLYISNRFVDNVPCNGLALVMPHCRLYISLHKVFNHISIPFIPNKIGHKRLFSPKRSVCSKSNAILFGKVGYVITFSEIKIGRREGNVLHFAVRRSCDQVILLRDCVEILLISGLIVNTPVVYGSANIDSEALCCFLKTHSVLKIEINRAITVPLYHIRGSCIT